MASSSAPGAAPCMLTTHRDHSDHKVPSKLVPDIEIDVLTFLAIFVNNVNFTPYA